MSEAPLEQADPLLIFSPESINVGEPQFNPLCLDRGEALKGLGGAFLPPTRHDSAIDETSYFSLRRRLLRAEIARLFSGYGPEDRPTALAMWQLVDDPLARDLFLDGAALQVLGKPGEGTRLRLATFHRDSAQIDWLRATIFTAPPNALPLPVWARPIGQLLRSDLAEAVGGYLTFGNAQDPLDWLVPRQRARDHGAPREGSWDVFERLRKRLDDPVLSELVLKPSFSSVESFADHDLAERLFASNVFRCPWRSDLDGAWHQAMLKLFEELAEGICLSPAERASGEGLELCPQEPERPLTVMYPSAADPEELLEWRLLFPLGTVFLTQSTVVLDRGSLLDRGYRVNTGALGSVPTARAFLAQGSGDE